MNKKGLFFIVLIFSALFISLNHHFRNAEAQEHDFILNLNNNFEMIQFSNINGSISSINSINIDLPSTEWNISKIELDFTNLTFDRETIVIEDQPMAYEKVYFDNNIHNRLGLATQIRLNHPETIYGVSIYGNKSATQDIQVQIQGYNEATNTPNGTILASQILNISTSLGWYLQNFSSPLNLPSGNYFLVLNGTNFSVNGQDYYWYYSSNPNDPSLYSAMTEEGYKRTNWLAGVNNKTFLYKLVRKSNALLFPESINMTVKINNQSYKVLNDIDEGTGVYSQTFQNFLPESLSLYIPSYNNASKTLIFNVTYRLYFEKILTTQGTTDIEESQSNLWVLTPIFIRQTDNYTVKFNIPSNWENISVFRDSEDITLEVIINLIDRYLFIPNNTLIQGADWEIRANSPNISFNINAPKLEFFLGQELRFSLDTPYLEGNYTFILIDSADIVEYSITKTTPLIPNLFSYNLASNLPEGIYIAYLFWNNQTNAGVQVQEFLIKLPIVDGFDPSLLILIGIIVAIIVVSSIVSYIGVSKILKNRNYKIDKILEKCIDILNLNYLIVTDNRSGIDVYSQSFGEQKLDPSLISGFLQAVREFGTEASVDKGSRTVKIDYKNSVILLTEFVSIRLILNMKATPSENFYYDIESLAYDVYKHYGKAVEDFRGNVKQFQGIKDLVEKHLNTSFIYPLEVVISETVKLSQSEREMVNKALYFMKEHNFDYIYSLYLLPENECSPKDAQTILSLIEKGIFKPKK